MRLSRIVCAVLFAICFVSSFANADEANIKSLTAALEKFALPEMPDELKQQLSDYVPNDLKARRDAANRQSTAEWAAITTREQWEKFRKEKITLLRKSLGRSWAGDDWKPPQTAKHEIGGTIQGAGYRIDKIVYPSAYGQWITANLYIPEPARAKMPGFVISHAHHTPKEQGELQDMGVLWARAGCYVLVPDHLGHGERRQHPFNSKADYDKDFQVSRQDYYHRYDVNLQLNLVGESLMGCLASDLMSGVSLLLNQPGIDREKISLLGAVAGGGDPCAVAAALDERITCAAPFNFGGPQPETRYPLPEGVEFNYGGSGGWESTRNLAFSYRDGFLPWVIVGSIAPRRLIYSHEFSWDREHDPVWARFQKIYNWYDKPDHLASTHGHGTLTSKDPPGSHCTHIGKVHRKQMHEALAKWFDIQLPGGEESPERRDSSELKCWTPELRAKLKPEPLYKQLAKKLSAPPRDQNWTGPVRGGATPKIEWASPSSETATVKVRSFVLRDANQGLIPVHLLTTAIEPALSSSGVFVITRSGKEEFIRQRAAILAQLLDAGLQVALADTYSTGATGTSLDRGRRSSMTGRASTLAMFGLHLCDLQSQDANDALQWLQAEQGWNPKQIGLWSDSLVPPNPADVAFQIPRDDDGRLPPGPDPLPQIVAWQFNSLAKAIYIRGGLNSYQSALDRHLMLLPEDSLPLPGEVRSYLSPPPSFLNKSNAIVRHDQTVDALNREVSPADGQPADHDPQTAAAWLISQLKPKK